MLGNLSRELSTAGARSDCRDLIAREAESNNSYETVLEEPTAAELCELVIGHEAGRVHI